MDDILHLLPIVQAAMRRIPDFWHYTEADLQVESIWQLRQLRVTSRGTIHWKACRLGRQLFEALGEAQNWRCCYCGITMVTDAQYSDGDDRYATFEHIRTLSDGGTDHPDNLVIACLRCNSKRSNMPVIDFIRYYSKRYE